MFPKTISFLILISLFLSACAGAEIIPPPSTTIPSSSDTPIPPKDATMTPTATSEPTPGVVTPAPWAPAAGDENLKRGNIFIDTTEILILESFPMQYMLHVQGRLPTPCHLLRAVVTGPDAQNQIQVEVYSLVEAKICTDVIKPFDISIPLGSYSTGKYSVWVNGTQVGEIAP